MAGDPMAQALTHGEDPYGTSAAFTTLLRAFEKADPQALAAVSEQYLHRLALLEHYLEEKLGVEISRDDLQRYLEHHHEEVRQETYTMAQRFFGSLAHREGA